MCDMGHAVGLALEWKGRRHGQMYRMPWLWRAYLNWKFHRLHPGFK